MIVCVDGLESGDGQRRGLTGTGLGLRNHVTPRDNRDDSALLDGRRLLELYAE